MPTFVRLALAAGLLLPLAACKGRKEAAADREKKEAEELRAERTVDAFTGVDLTFGEAVVGVGDKYTVKAEAPDEVLPKLDMRVENGRLVLGFKPNTPVEGSPKITYTVTAPKLDSARVSLGQLRAAQLTGTVVRIEAGTGGTVVVDQVAAKHLGVTVGPSGSVTVANGTAEAADVNAAFGTSTLAGKFGLLTVRAAGNLKVSGTVMGRLEATASGSGAVQLDGQFGAVVLKAEGSGSATVTAKKTASLRADLSGSGKLKATGGDLGHVTVKGEGGSSGAVSGKLASLRAELSGSAELTATGSAANLTAEVTSSGKLTADRLQVEVATVTAQNSAEVTVQATRALTATAENSAKVLYKGTAQVTPRVQGGATIAPLGK